MRKITPMAEREQTIARLRIENNHLRVEMRAAMLHPIRWAVGETVRRIAEKLKGKEVSYG